MVEAVVFDWGGVITKKTLTSAFYGNMVAEYGVDRDALVKSFKEFGVYYEKGEWSSEKFFTRLAKQISLNADWKKVESVFVNSVEHDEEVIRFIEGLGRKHDLYLLSDNYKEVTKAIAPVISSLFKKTFYSCDYGVTKTSPEFFEIMLEEINAKPAECVFIDDSQKNLETAKKLGINAILYTGLDALRRSLKDYRVK